MLQESPPSSSRHHHAAPMTLPQHRRRADASVAAVAGTDATALPPAGLLLTLAVVTPPHRRGATSTAPVATLLGQMLIQFHHHTHHHRHRPITAVVASVAVAPPLRQCRARLLRGEMGSQRWLVRVQITAQAPWCRTAACPPRPPSAKLRCCLPASSQEVCCLLRLGLVKNRVDVNFARQAPYPRFRPVQRAFPRFFA